MSELREELLIPSISKKRVILVAGLSVLLVAAFATSIFFTSLLFGSTRLTPNDELADAEIETPELMLPEFPFDEDFLKDLFENLDLEDIESISEMLQEMFDGNIDDLDLSLFAAAAAALLFSDADVFNVYDYNQFTSDLSEILWKYESFDEFRGDTWHSNANKDMYEYFTYNQYYSEYIDRDIYKLKIPTPVNQGPNSFVIPSLFPIPNIMEDSIEASGLVPDSAVLFKNDFNSTTVDSEFSTENTVNISYELFGNTLPTNEEINSSSLDEALTPSEISDRYLQLPPDINTYLATNPYFKSHYDALDAIIDVSDTAFEVANKIRNYLQSNFAVGVDELTNDGPAEEEDIVEWFCEHEEGLWSEFASAFCAFTRAFGVSSRYINGFNSRGIEETFDSIEGKNTFSVKYRNIYNWAEVYIPTNISGDGMWVQMDVIFDTFGEGGGINYLTDVNLTISSDFESGFRPDTATITATLTSNDLPVSGENIVFTDFYSGVLIDQIETDANGEAIIVIDIDDTQVVGPHYIRASFFEPVSYTNIYADTNYTVYGPVNVVFQSITPNQIDRSVSDIVNLNGYVEDAVNGEKVPGADLIVNMYYNDTDDLVFMGFNSSYIISDQNGNINSDLEVDPNIARGDYDIRLDFNGTWVLASFGSINIINASSDKLRLTITDDIPYHFDFFIDNYPSQIDDLPLIDHWSNIELKAVLTDEFNTPIPDEQIEFWDYHRNEKIGDSWTNESGIATMTYWIGDENVAGPNLLYADYNGIRNYSYFVIQNNFGLSLDSFPLPREINRTAEGISQFVISGMVYDTTYYNHPIRYSEVSVKLFQGSIDYSYLLEPLQSNPYLTNETGRFSLTFDVDDNTPPGNYSLRVYFNGTIIYPETTPKPAAFDLEYLSWLPIFVDSRDDINDNFYELKINAPDEYVLDFWIDDVPSDQDEDPVKDRYDNTILKAYAELGGIIVPDGTEIIFFDVTENFEVARSTTTGGFAQFSYYLNDNIVAGPHLMYMEFNGHRNHSYFILNASIFVNIDSGPIPMTIDKSNQDIFNIQGTVQDDWGNLVKNADVSIRIINNTIDYSNRLILTSGSTLTDQNGQFDVTYSVQLSTPTQNYTVEVWFNGDFQYSGPKPYVFSFPSNPRFTSFMTATNELSVYDSTLVEIIFKINGQHTRNTYDDLYPPFTSDTSEEINFYIKVIQGGNPNPTGTVSLIDVYNNSRVLNSSNLGAGGEKTLLVNTDLLYRGLHRIDVIWAGSSTYNTTYVVINKTINVNIDQNDFNKTRNTDGFTISGDISDNGLGLRGLEVKIRFLNTSNLNDESQYFNLVGTDTMILNDDGTFSFTASSITLSCPNKSFYIRIDFNGTIQYEDVSLTTYMLDVSSSIKINVTAGTTIIQRALYTEYEAYYPDDWVVGDTLYINGTFLWDDGNPITGMYINVTLQELDGTIIAENYTEVTHMNGDFNATLAVQADWPSLRSDTKVVVYFYPLIKVNFGSEGYWVDEAIVEFI